MPTAMIRGELHQAVVMSVSCSTFSFGEPPGFASDDELVGAVLAEDWDLAWKRARELSSYAIVDCGQNLEVRWVPVGALYRFIPRGDFISDDLEILDLTQWIQATE